MDFVSMSVENPDEPHKSFHRSYQWRSPFCSMEEVISDQPHSIRYQVSTESSTKNELEWEWRLAIIFSSKQKADWLSHWQTAVLRKADEQGEAEILVSK
jgi:hypothetical protein